MKKFPISKTESEWLGILGGNGPDATKAFRVLFHKATEAPGTGLFHQVVNKI